jgi:hypothetical protein
MGVVFDWIDIHRFLRASMVLEVCLAIPFKVGDSQPQRAGDRSFEKSGGPNPVHWIRSLTVT